MQYLVAPLDLQLDLPRQPALRQRRHVDGDVGLVQHLVCVERRDLGQGVRRHTLASLRADLFHRSRADGDRRRHLVVVAQCGGGGGQSVGADRHDHADPERKRTAHVVRRRLLVREEGGEAGHGGRVPWRSNATDTG